MTNSTVTGSWERGRASAGRKVEVAHGRGTRQNLPSLSLAEFVSHSRVAIHQDGSALRLVSYSDLLSTSGIGPLANYIADRAPLFYREPDKISETLHDGYFLTAFREALSRLPTSQSFHESHLGEILAGIFAERFLDLRLLYSKLTLLTAENANANKSDLIMYRPGSDPIQFVLGEVKTSMKSSVPAHHDKSCYPDLFNSLRDYTQDDLFYDLTAAKDRIHKLPTGERARVKQSLLPGGRRTVLFAGFCVIDSTTRTDDETQMLATRVSPKTFDIDLVCVETLKAVSSATYQKLEALRASV